MARPILARELDSGPAGHRATSRISRRGDDDSLCDPIKGVADALERGRSVVERGGTEMADHRSEHKQRKVCSHSSCHGRGLPSIIPAMTFSRARRSTRKTSACVVLGWSSKDSIRQWRLPPTSLIARRIIGSSNRRASTACIAPARQNRPSLSRSLPLHHCCSFISKRSTAPSLASGLFPHASNSVPSRGIFLLRASHLVRVTLGQPPDGTIGPRRAPGSAIRQPPVFCQVPSPAAGSLKVSVGQVLRDGQE